MKIDAPAPLAPKAAAPPRDEWSEYRSRLRRPGTWLGVAAALAGLWGFLHVSSRYFTGIDARIQRGIFANTSNLYAAPMRVQVGDAVPQAEVATQLRRLGYTEGAPSPLGWYRVDRNGLEVHPPASAPQPEPVLARFEKDVLKDVVSLRTRRSADGLALQPELLGNVVHRSRERRRLVRFADLPPVLVQAVLSVEDKRFFQHPGFDPVRIAKAAYVNLQQERNAQGASTITMQLARNLFLDADKSWSRKLTELMIGLRLEQRLPKEQILEHYCNQVYLGRRETFNIHGFGEGARVFFGKPVDKLTASEAALLAGLVQRPSYLNPFRTPERAKERRNVVLALMHKNGHLSAADYAQAVASPVVLAPEVKVADESSYFMDLANRDRETKSGALPEGESHRVFTTLDLHLQQAAEEAVRIGMAKVDRQLRGRRVKGETSAPPQVALVALDPHTGEVKAIVGGRDYAASQLNRAVALRQPGSVFKPFVYAAALQTAVSPVKGKVLTLSTTVEDVPTTFRFEKQVYQPGNFHDSYHGTVSFRQALAKSMNIPAVRVAEMVGYRRVVDLVQRAGMNDKIQPTPAVALGAYEATPLEVAGAYTIFANGGQYVRPTFIHRVETSEGAVVHEHQPQPRPVLDPRVAYIAVDMMQEVVRSGTAAGVRSAGLRIPVAAKTGTSRDGWFAGFTSDLLCVVWVGYDDNRELDLEGSKSAMPIWIEFMERALQQKRYAKEFSMPTGITRVSIDSETGLAAGPDCPISRTELFVKGTEPRRCHGEHFDDPYSDPSYTTTSAGAVDNRQGGFLRKMCLWCKE